MTYRICLRTKKVAVVLTKTYLGHNTFFAFNAQILALLIPESPPYFADFCSSAASFVVKT